MGVRDIAASVRSYQPTKAAWFWSCAGAAIMTMAIGFTWGGWVTRGGAEAMAQKAVDEARIELAAAFCVERFMAAPDAEAQLIELRDETRSWQRHERMTKGGWVSLPGMARQANKAGELCAQRLLALETPPA